MKKEYELRGIDCGNCAAKIERAVNQLEQVESATVNSSKFILFLHVFPLSNVSVSKTRLLRHDRPQVHNRSSFLFSPP